MTKVYEEICVGCIDEKWCHDNEAVCDDYLELVEMIEQVEGVKDE